MLSSLSLTAGLSLLSFCLAATTSPGLQPSNFGANDECGSCRPPPNRNDTTKASEREWQYVCIIGNAQKRRDALRSHRMWNDAFVSFWHIWDHDNVSVEPDEVPPNIYFVDSQDTMSWAQGINFLLVHVKNLYSCEYFFTHDDDLSFKVKNVSDSRPLASVLTSILLDYQPAVAGFPWIFGEKTYAGMKDLAAFQQLHPIVNVLTGFDSGMLLFHKSVVDFFIPYSPRGEGAFTGNWSLCAHFINLFAPLTFKENAIRINAIEYENLVSISNVPKNKRKKLVLKVDEDGLALNAESRHPYEYRFNRPYMRFLTGGLLNHNQRWGREMMQRDITWEVKPISRGWNVDEVKQGYKKHRHFDKWNVLTRISEFYDISYPALSRNAWIRDKFNQEQLLDFVESRQQKGRDFSFTLHLFTTARDLTTFSLLWASLNTGNRISSPVKIYIHVDNQEVLSEKSTFISNIRKLRKLKCIHGTVSLRISSRRKGLIQTIMDAWSSMASEEIGILLPNETTILSRHFLEYAQQTTRQYLLSPSHHPTVMGVSLHPHEFNLPLVSSTATLFTILQYPPSTGFIVSPTYWTAFVAWFARLPAAFEPVLYDSPDINVWDARLRWDKFLARYLVERGLAFVVPRFPGDRTLVAEQIDTAQLVELTDASVEDKDGFWKGLSERGKDGKWVLRLNAQPLRPVKLQTHNEGVTELIQFAASTNQDEDIPGLRGDFLYPAFKHLPRAESLPLYTYQLKPAKKHTPTALKFGKKARAIYKCIMHLFVQDRTRVTSQRVAYYAMHPLIDSIVVIWNNPTENATVLLPLHTIEGLNTTMIPLHVVVPRVTSSTNRFRASLLPPASLTRECIINLDEDTDLHHDDLTGAIRAFQLSKGYDGIVRIERPDVTYVDPLRLGGAVFHMKLMKWFESELSESLQNHVDAKGGCADVLFHAMVRKRNSKPYDGDELIHEQVFRAQRVVNAFPTDEAFLFGIGLNCSQFHT